MRAALLSRRLHRARLEAILPHIRGDVLDIGCGSAAVAGYLAKSQSYVGIEVDPVMVAELQRNRPGHTFLGRDVDNEPIDLPPGQFDTILLIAVIEHLRRPEWVLGQVRDVLRPEGRVIITTPTPWGDTLLRWGGRLGLFTRAALDVHERVYSKADIEQLAASSGYMVPTLRRFEFGCNWLAVLTPISGG